MNDEGVNESLGLLRPLSFRNLTLLPRAIKRAYQHEYLVKKLPRIAVDGNPEAVLREQIDFYGAVTGRRPPWRCMVKFGQPLVEGVRYSVGGGRGQYRAFVDWTAAHGMSAHSRLLDTYPGNYCLSSDVLPDHDDRWEEYVDTVFEPYGISVSAVVNYHPPFRAKLRMGMYYAFDGPAEDVPPRFTFDFITLPFAIVWLHRFGLVDEATMRHWLFMLVGLTPAQLFMIREVIGAPRYHSSLVAERTGLTKRNLERQFYQLSDVLNEKMPRDPDMPTNGSILVDLSNNYGFLSFTGRPAYQFEPLTS